ncbi:hypothetical protein FACS1894211_15490 [Clostridia bacterium]|nr:hypothetical protein FACS1894211_15490 [Clostridia bacterium]
MAHLEKYTQKDYRKLLMHYERAKDGNGQYHKYKNQDVDLSRTYQNYNVANFQTLPQAEFMDKRLAQLKIFNRSDVKYLCDWIVTLPKLLGNGDERKFFDAVFRFLAGKYKRENVVSAYVHKDETQPHMHFAFIPVAMDKKRNIKKLCSKDIVGRDDLLKFHEELDDYLTNVFGCNTGVRNGATIDGNRSIDELKRGTAVKALKEVRAARETEEKRIDGLRWGDRITPVKEKRDAVVISKADYDSANDALTKRYLLEERAREAETEKRKVLDKDYRKDNFRLEVTARKLKAEKAALETERNNLSNRLQRYDKVFKKNPNLLEEFLRLAAELERIEQLEQRIAQAERQARKQAEKEEMQM